LKGNMQTNHPEPTLPSSVNSERPPARRRIRLAAISLTAMLLAGLAAHSLTPVVPGRAETLPTRISWYLRHGQVQADLRTLGSLVVYLLQPERDLPALNQPTEMPLTVNPGAGGPKS
jgi:hypothetical protein